jgi:hypothetical protein
MPHGRRSAASFGGKTVPRRQPGRSAANIRRYQTLTPLLRQTGSPFGLEPSENPCDCPLLCWSSPRTPMIRPAFERICRRFVNECSSGATGAAAYLIRDCYNASLLAYGGRRKTVQCVSTGRTDSRGQASRCRDRTVSICTRCGRTARLSRRPPTKTEDTWKLKASRKY